MPNKRLSLDEAKRRAQVVADKAETRTREMSRILEAEQVERKAVAEKTARLRALRLAKEAADAQAAAAAAAAEDGKQGRGPRKHTPAR
ncbi:hypothetical protein [Bosea sp. BK604]|uniref:hypothetical protein n=1 Tax=Bosea sp. BK604 TaxID=2512180 RepID=UPI0010450D20|nr:hypothetical protein [Bosea sp. BK604]TCR63380.1 hypothetical protein EV560_10827 [Bosea sp. BK604]